MRSSLMRGVFPIASVFFHEFHTVKSDRVRIRTHSVLLPSLTEGAVKHWPDRRVTCGHVGSSKSDIYLEPCKRNEGSRSRIRCRYVTRYLTTSTSLLIFRSVPHPD